MFEELKQKYSQLIDRFNDFEYNSKDIDNFIEEKDNLIKIRKNKK